MKVIKLFLIIFFFILFSEKVHGYQKQTYIIAPQSFISDFPNEKISIQALNLTMEYNDVVIPGNAGMDIVVTRFQSKGLAKLGTITLGTYIAYSANKPVFNASCLGEFQSLGMVNNGRPMVAKGYNIGSQLPNNVLAAYDDNSYLSCEGNQPTLHTSDGRKLSFEQNKVIENSYYKSTSYYLSMIEDRYGNSISYTYEEDTLPVSYNAPKLLKRITRNDGQIVDFFYHHVGQGVSRTSLARISYSGKNVQYIYENSNVKTFRDAAGRETKYTYIGVNVDTVTTPDGLVVDYQFRPTMDNVAARLPTKVGEMSLDLADYGSSGGQLVGKSIVGPGVDKKWYSYSTIYNVDVGYKTLVFEKNYKGDLDLTTEYTIHGGHYQNFVGQIHRIRRFEGKFLDGDRRGTYSSHDLLYEQINTWKKINNGEAGCHLATKPPLDNLIDCSKYEISGTQLNIKNNDDFDVYSTVFSEFNIYGQHSKAIESFGNRTKVIKQSYDHDVLNWILNQPLKTQIGTSVSSLKNTEEVTYYSKNHVSYPFMPNEFKSFGVWQKKHTQYHTSGDIKKIEYNEKLTFGDKTLNRYQLLANYKRGIAQTITTPGRYSSTPISYTKLVDDNGWVTQEVDFEGNIINYGYDNIGRLKYVDPRDDKWSDTLNTWLYDIGGHSNNTQKVVSLCRLNSSKTACLSNKKLTSTTTFDAKSRPIETITTDIDNQKNIYKNFIYNHFDRLIFASFPSESLGENFGKTYDYDGLQRLISETVSNGGTQYTNYLSGNRVQVYDFRGKPTTTTYLAYGRPDYSQAVNILSTKGINTSLNVNVYGQVQQITQSGPHKNTTISQTQTNLYDDNKNLCMVKRTDVGNTYYKYNALNEMVWFAQGVSGSTCDNHRALSSQKVILGYDNNGNQHTKTFADGTPQIKTILDENGDIKNLTSGSVSQVYEYNSARLLEKETLNVDGKTLALDYDYNSLGHIDSLIYPSLNKVFFAPNAFGQPTKAGSYVTSIQYHPNGQVDTFNYGNGLVYRQTLDDQKRPYNLTVNKGSVSRLSQTYTYDNSNNIKHIYDNTNHYYDIDLGYDDMDRLDYANSNAWGSGSFSYDGLGNLTGKALGAQNLTYNYNTKKQLSTVTGAASYNFQYNKDGSVKHNGRYGLTYNSANQLKNANGNSYVYDGNNRLVKKTSSGQATYSFYSLTGTLYQVIPADGNLTEYIYLGDKLVAKELAFKEVDDTPIYKYKPATPTHLGGSATTCSNFLGCTLYISWKHSNINNVTYFELDQRGDSNTGECSKGNVCLDSVAPVKQLTLIKINNEWVRIYNGKSLFNRPTIKGASADYRVRACNPVGCSSYSAVITVNTDNSI